MESSRLDTRNLAWYAAGALTALVPSCVMWGFTVDDALISIRYAHHVITGAGYTFNAGAPATDGVTPLPWPFLLAPLAHTSDLVAVLVRAKVLGILAWTVAAAALGRALASSSSRGSAAAQARRLWPLVFVGLAFPVGAWAASGMETGLATALATFAAISFGNANRAALFAGLAAALRPELVPWALALSSGAALASPDHVRGRDRLLPAGIAFSPFAVCTAIRLAAFGSPVPLAIMAKPSDAAHGIVYAVAAMVVGLLPCLVVAPFALRHASSRAKAIVIATLVHFGVMVAVGGDWMPYARLIVPILPALALAAIDVAAVARRSATYGRAAVALALGIYCAAGAAPAGRHVHQDRAALIETAKPALAGAKVIAALDIGWVGAAAPDARIVDLAGLTDPTIAALPGGHTSKAVDLAMLLDRNVDTLLVFFPPRQVEQRLLESPLFEERFEARARLPLVSTSYVVFHRR